MDTTTTYPESMLGKLSKAALVLAAIGAINWGLVGFFDFNLVDAVLGGGSNEETSAASRVLYALVGLAGLASLPLLKAVLPDRDRTAAHPTMR